MFNSSWIPLQNESCERRPARTVPWRLSYHGIDFLVCLLELLLQIFADFSHNLVRNEVDNILDYSTLVEVPPESILIRNAANHASQTCRKCPCANSVFTLDRVWRRACLFVLPQISTLLLPICNKWDISHFAVFHHFGTTLGVPFATQRYIISLYHQLYSPRDVI